MKKLFVLFVLFVGCDALGVTATNVDAVAQDTVVVDEIQRKKEACLGGNVGISDTFVWSSRNANIDNYSMMVEDVLHPENNSCYVKVKMGTKDGGLYLSDIPAKYFELGRSIQCGQWVDKEGLKQRILDAKKKGRVWGTVGATVGSAVVGVGVMEAFGNKLLGDKVQGQKALSGQELLISQLKVLKKKDSAEYNKVVEALKKLDEICAKDWKCEKPEECDPLNNDFLGLVDLLDKE